MGAPWFKIRHLAESAGLVALSANFALYGDLSDRMMSLAAGLGPQQEIYSIDESFIDVTGVRGNLVERCHKIRARILQWVGIPCGIGIASTKTLAKLANHVAKSAERKPGSYPADLAQVCNLAALTRPALERTVRELQGTCCIELEHAPERKKEIACTRSFGHFITELSDLTEAVTEFASRTAQKLRQQGSLASQILVFIRTSPFRPEAQYSRSTTVPLRRPSADSAVLVAAALAGLQAIYRPGFKYAKAGVMLLELQSETVQQGELTLQRDDELIVDRRRLMSALDGLNQRYGRGTLLMASAGLAGNRRAWSMKQERRTPGYTTCWDDLAVARA